MNPFMIRLRSMLRKTGLLRVLSAIRIGLSPADSYEERFSSQMLSSIRPGDTVWDIGANLGLYTSRFLDRTSAGGGIVCFEPAPECFHVLQKKFSEKHNVRLENIALGKEVSSGFLQLASNPTGATHRLQDGAICGDGESVPVSIMSGDAYLKNGGAVPNVVKIDVEGFEEDVLLGMEGTLSDSSLRAVFCEVHFAILEERGAAMAPVRIQQLLANHGFITDWVDASHLRAVRKS